MDKFEQFQCSLCSIYFREVMWLDGKVVCFECVKDCVRFQLGERYYWNGKRLYVVLVVGPQTE
jgi:hypothetical protein